MYAPEKHANNTSSTLGVIVACSIVLAAIGWVNFTACGSIELIRVLLTPTEYRAHLSIYLRAVSDSFRQQCGYDWRS